MIAEALESLPAAPVVAGVIVVLVVAHTLKAATGFGPAIVTVAFGGLLVGPRTAVLLSAALDVFSALLLLNVARRDGGLGRLGQRLVAGLLVGTLVGSLLLGRVPAGSLDVLVGVLVLAVAGWFLAGRPGASLDDSADVAVVPAGLVAGVCGGLLGINGPPLIAVLGRRLGRERLRALLVPAFFAAGVVQTTTYAATGLYDLDILTLVVVGVPAVVVGRFLGEHVFRSLDERRFELVVGVLLVIAGGRLVL